MNYKVRYHSGYNNDLGPSVGDVDLNDVDIVIDEETVKAFKGNTLVAFFPTVISVVALP